MAPGKVLYKARQMDKMFASESKEKGLGMIFVWHAQVSPGLFLIKYPPTRSVTHKQAGRVQNAHQVFQPFIQL